jgi:ABC-type transport system involved in multi-copper enzyme maturation permease subunit
MFNALLHKEWIQLRALRWIGLALGLLLPLFLVASAEAAQKGWLPFGRVSNYSPETLYLEVLPAFVVGLWMLLALLITGQVFAGDRATGTEQFLLERPVRRSSIWAARLAASAGTLIVQMLCHAIVWWLIARSMADPNALAWGTALRTLGIGATVGALVAFVAGLVAGSLLNSPMQAVLLGLVLGVIPVGLAGFMTGLFPFAFYRYVPVGAVVPLLLLVGYVFGSFYALCRGEPAGRRRWLRGIVPLGVALLAIPLAFVIAAPLAMRLDAGRLVDGAYLAPSPQGRLTAVFGQRGAGWLVDLASGRRTRFLPPPIDDASWNPDGSLLAVVNAAGGLGRYSQQTKIDFYDVDGRRVRRVTAEDEIPYFGGVTWAGRYVVARTMATVETSGLVIVSIDTGEISELALGQPFGTWTLLGPTPDGTLYVLRRLEHPPGARWERGTQTLVLQRLIVEAAVLDSEILLEEEGFAPPADQPEFTYFYVQKLSPEGRYLVRSATSALDLKSGEDVALHNRYRSAWLSGDRLAWLESGPEGTGLFVGTPGMKGERIRNWDEGAVFIEASPDRARLLARVYRDAVSAPRFPARPNEVEFDELLETWVYDLSSGTWSNAQDWFVAGTPDDSFRIHWAGPRTLAQVGDGRLVLVGLQAPAERHYVIGSP